MTCPTDPAADTDEFSDNCPECGKKLIGGDNYSGVKCPDPECGYWFCF